ncbi:MAG TPA: LacI family DNA-binding transcriptional regulator, partial [Candidatus Limnocylindrales bacterium]|nr:LacI family DNA-binding transcriptional regulator [Candidatus Limnocylindrales bacterium]
MRDVAALAGVSLKTVSRVINAEPAVSDDLLARVQRAIEQLDYRPNLTASSLRRSDRKTATVGLVLEDLANPYSAAVT